MPKNFNTWCVNNESLSSSSSDVNNNNVFDVNSELINKNVNSNDNCDINNVKISAVNNVKKKLKCEMNSDNNDKKNDDDENNESSVECDGISFESMNLMFNGHVENAICLLKSAPVGAMITLYEHDKIIIKKMKDMNRPFAMFDSQCSQASNKMIRYKGQFYCINCKNMNKNMKIDINKNEILLGKIEDTSDPKASDFFIFSEEQDVDLESMPKSSLITLIKKINTTSEESDTDDGKFIMMIYESCDYDMYA